MLKGRGLFLSKYSPARLTIENVNYADQSVYKCRVDFKMAPTSISSITLQVIGKDSSFITKVWVKKNDTLIKFLNFKEFFVGENDFIGYIWLI